MCMHRSLPNYAWQTMEAIEFKMFKVSRCPCASIHCPRWTLSSLLFIHVQSPTHCKLRSFTSFLSLGFGTEKCSFICSPPLNNYSPHLQVVNYSYQSQGHGLRELEKQVGGPRLCPISASILILVPNCWLHWLPGIGHRWSRVGACCYQELALQRYHVRPGLLRILSSCRWSTPARPAIA